MSKTKGTDLVALRGILAEKDPQAEKTILADLEPRQAEIFKAITATSWTEVEDQMAIYQTAARYLFPGDDQAMMRLGMALAEKSFNGIYKIFLRIPAVEYLFKRVARIWNTYYERGVAVIEPQGRKVVDLVVRNFPDLPRPMREVACGHYRVILQLTGAKNVRIALMDEDPQAWRWRIQWE